MSKKISVIGLLLDMTGSMSPYSVQTVDSVNEYILGLKNGIKGKSRFVLAVFNSQEPFKVLIDDDIKKADGISYGEYKPDYTTPLYDAMARMMAHLEGLVDGYKATGPEEVRVIFTTLTDGYENASREYSLDSVKKLIDEKRSKNWEPVFLGANIDSFAAGGAMAISAGSTRDFDMSNVKGTLLETVSYTVRATNAENYAAGDFFTETDGGSGGS